MMAVFIIYEKRSIAHLKTDLYKMIKYKKSLPSRIVQHLEEKFSIRPYKKINLNKYRIKYDLICNIKCFSHVMTYLF